jgi:AP2-associated kinase
MAIMNGTYSIPQFPQYSDGLKNLISILLRVEVAFRPDIYQVYSRICSLRNAPYTLSVVLYASNIL